MTRRWLAFVSLAVAAATGVSTAARAECSFKKLAELPVTMSGLIPLVPAKVNGVDAKFVVDSGAFASTITWAAASRAKVPGRGSAKAIQGVSGQAAVDVGVARTFELAGLPFGSMTFLIGADAIGGSASGLLGQNVLGRLDVEYDFANGVVRLFSAENCADAFLAYWAKDGQAGMLAMGPRSRTRPAIIVQAAVNGQPIRALLDTGASTSMVKLSAASRAGIKTGSEGVKTTGASYGISGRPVDTWLAPVSSFAFGDEQIRNTRLRISDIELNDADMLIGADFFLSHRIFVSNSQGRIYFTYNGGPVFRLDAPPPAVAAAASADTPPLADADAYDRRGAAFAARRDFTSAIADYSQAVEMEPKTARHVQGRAQVYVAAGKPELALADLDTVLTLTPDDLTARVQRARLRLRAKDLPKARADLEEMLKNAPADSSREMEIAEILEDEGYPHEAVPYIDRWIAGHAEDKHLSQALNSRCWARAIWGQELDLALADCEAALRRGPRAASFLDSRALVRLRMGQVDAALSDYDAALRIEPRQAWSLYARGLARHRKGLKAEGDEDIAAALKLQENLPELAKRYGLEDLATSGDKAAPGA